MKKVVGISKATPKATQQWVEAYKKISGTPQAEEHPIACALRGLDRSSANYRFQVLVANVLSARTRSSVAACKNQPAVIVRLQEHGLTVDRIVETSDEELEDLLKGVSFFRNKSKNVKRIAEICQQEYSGDIPNTYKKLIALPGVGPKSALFTMNLVNLIQCFDKAEGISVDSHVHRIANRLEWVSTSNHNQTKSKLESLIPEELWGEINFKLVDFGNTLCLPQNPKCRECPLRDSCPYALSHISQPNKSQK